MKILHRDQLPLGGFAGLKEHRLVTDLRAWGRNKAPNSWDGLGNFVYLADARFMPKGETGLHPHLEIDVISFMLEGRIAHEGSLEHGEMLQNYDVQVQRAGGEGFSHNEVNPDINWNRMIQLWVLPEKAGELSAYKKYKPEQGEITQIYGGENSQNTFNANTSIQLALLNSGQELSLRGDFMAYVCLGAGEANSIDVKDGDLLAGSNLAFKASTPTHLILVQVND